MQRALSTANDPGLRRGDRSITMVTCSRQAMTGSRAFCHGKPWARRGASVKRQCREPRFRS